VPALSRREREVKVWAALKAPGKPAGRS
jgi:hypothetical protein